MSTKKLTYEEVKKQVENSGYVLLSKEYINNRTRLKVMCKNGHINEYLLNYIKAGHKCIKCNSIDVNNIKKFLKSIGYELISNAINKCYSNIKVKCSNGHIYTTKWNYIRNGYRCTECKKIARKNIRLNKIRKEIERCGYKLLDDVYISATDISFPISTIDANGAVVFKNDTSGTLVNAIDFGSKISSNNGVFQVPVSNGFVKIM